MRHHAKTANERGAEISNPAKTCRHCGAKKPFKSGFQHGTGQAADCVFWIERTSPIRLLTCLRLESCYGAPVDNTLNGRGPIMAVVGVGVALGALIVGLHQNTSVAIRNVQLEVHDVRNDIADIGERMARLEWLFKGHLGEDSQ